jgi:hypothetical protein
MYLEFYSGSNNCRERMSRVGIYSLSFLISTSITRTSMFIVIDYGLPLLGCPSVQQFPKSLVGKFPIINSTRTQTLRLHSLEAHIFIWWQRMEGSMRAEYS